MSGKASYSSAQGEAFGKRVLVAVLRRGLGRRSFVRLARFLLDQARLDVPNNIRTNGELLVQVAACALGSPDELVVYDVGANVGQWSCELVRTVREQNRSGLDLFAFEPARSAHAELVRRLKSAEPPGVAHAISVGMSSESGLGYLYKPHEKAGSSSLHEDKRFQYLLETVHLSTVDEFVRNSSAARIHLLKVDAEGHDLSVLEGANGLLKEQAIDLVQFEYNYRWIFGRHYLRDAFELLGRFGYTIGKITPEGIEFYPGWHQELETFREGNYLACLQRHIHLFRQVTWWNLEGRGGL